MSFDSCLPFVSYGSGLPLFAIVTLCFWVVHRALFSPLSSIPGPRIASFTNLWLKLQVLRGRRVHYIHALHEKYGKIVRISPTEVSVCDVESVQQIHKVGAGYLKSPWYQMLVSSPVPGLFASIDPKHHGARRRLFAQAMSNTSILTWEPLVREKVDFAVSKIKRDAEAGDADILKWWRFLATDTIGHLCFGDSFNMLVKEEKDPYIRDLEILAQVQGVRAELPSMVWILERLPISAADEITKIPDRLNSYGTRAIEKTKALARTKEGAKSNLFSKMIAAGELETLTDFDIEHEASNFIIAGSDTTAVVLTYMAWAVLKRPGIQKRVQKEVRKLKPDWTSKDAEALPYLSAVIEETLRLYCAAPSTLPRTVPPGGRIIGGYFIPENMTVGTHAYTTHRLTEIFPEPNEFKPERWLNPTPEMKVALTPFGGGSRTCIGIHLARLELLLSSARFFQECAGAKISPTTTDADMDLENYFLVAPRGHRCEITLG